jgi:hypothetical protein
MLFAWNGDLWVFHGSYANEDAVTRVMRTLTARFKLSRFHIFTMSEKQAQAHVGDTWT